MNWRNFFLTLSSKVSHNLGRGNDDLSTTPRQGSSNSILSAPSRLREKNLRNLASQDSSEPMWLAETRRREERGLFSMDCKKDLNVEEFGKRLFAWWLGKITCQNHCQASADEDADHGHDRVLGAQGREFEVGIGSPLRLAK